MNKDQVAWRATVARGRSILHLILVPTAVAFVSCAASRVIYMRGQPQKIMLSSDEASIVDTLVAREPWGTAAEKCSYWKARSRWSTQVGEGVVRFAVTASEAWCAEPPNSDRPAAAPTSAPTSASTAGTGTYLYFKTSTSKLDESTYDLDVYVMSCSESRAATSWKDLERAGCRTPSDLDLVLVIPVGDHAEEVTRTTDGWGHAFFRLTRILREFPDADAKRMTLKAKHDGKTFSKSIDLSNDRYYQLAKEQLARSARDTWQRGVCPTLPSEVQRCVAQQQLKALKCIADKCMRWKDACLNDDCECKRDCRAAFEEAKRDTCCEGKSKAAERGAADDNPTYASTVVAVRIVTTSICRNERRKYPAEDDTLEWRHSAGTTGFGARLRSWDRVKAKKDLLLSGDGRGPVVTLEGMEPSWTSETTGQTTQTSHKLRATVRNGVFVRGELITVMTTGGTACSLKSVISTRR